MTNFRTARYEASKAKALEAEKADKRKAAMDYWREAQQYCEGQKEFFECGERALENWNAYNAKFRIG